MIKTKDRADKEKKRKKILRKQGKEEEGLYLGGGWGLVTGIFFFCLQVDGPISGGGEWGVGVIARFYGVQVRQCKALSSSMLELLLLN